MATNNKDFVVKNGLIVGNSTNIVNYTPVPPANPFLGQLWVNEPFLYAWSSASTWVLIGDGTASAGFTFSASGTQFNIINTLITRSASGSFQIGAIDFHTASPISTTVGRMTWDDGSGTVLLGLKGGNINIPIGQQEDALVYNGTGSALARGQVVRIVGAQGQRPRIDLAAAISDANSSKTFGIVAEPILDAAEGFVTTFGIVNNINTAAFAEGASLWLSPSAGGIVSTMPIQPYHNVFLGYCLKSHASAGRIFVKIQNGYEIEELHDVLIQTASNNQILSYNSASSLWMNKDLQAAIKEIDGVSSGIDADLLDGQEGSYYLDWTNTTNKPDPIIGVSLSGNTTAAASVTLTDLTNGQISLVTNTNFATSASSINWMGITETPTTLSGYNISDGLRESDAASAYIRVTSSAAIVSGYIPVTASQAYLTRTDANIIYAPLASASLTGTPIAPTAASGTNTQQIATTAFVRTEVSNLIASAPATLDTLNELATALGNDPNFATSTASAIGQRLLASTASTLYMSIGSTANHANTASSINWTGIADKPDPIVGVSLTGAITGAASATLTDLTNGQVSITTSVTASPTFTGTTTMAAANVTGIFDANEIRETVVDVTLSTNTATLDWTAGNVYYIATAPTGAMTFNVTNLPTDNSKIMTVGVIVTQGSTGRIPSTFQIDGVSQTIKWVGGSAPTPTSISGKIDIFTFTIQRTSASAWIVYGTSSLGF